MTDHDVFEEGYDAYWNGHDREDNPYDHEQEGDKRNVWEEGWHKAREHDYDEDEG